jgi:periplasmic divalent cation tolerance protein
MPEPEDLLLVHTTCASHDQARDLAAALVERRLAACASIGAAIVSTYPWKGVIQHDEEIPVTFKTTRGAFGQLERVLAELHPYDEPEILAVPVAAASSGYSAWVRAWVRSEAPT